MRQHGHSDEQRAAVPPDESLGAWRGRVAAATGVAGCFRLICDGKELVDEEAAMRDVGQGAAMAPDTIVWLLAAPSLPPSTSAAAVQPAEQSMIVAPLEPSADAGSSAAQDAAASSAASLPPAPPVGVNCLESGFSVWSHVTNPVRGRQQA